MALILPKKCSECGETQNVDVHSFNGMCPECRAIAADKAKREHLAGLKGLTVEERLDRIEEILYDTNADSRLKAMESRFRTYA